MDEERAVFYPADGGEPQELQPGTPPDLNDPALVIQTRIVEDWIIRMRKEYPQVFTYELTSQLRILLLLHAERRSPEK